MWQAAKSGGVLSVRLVAIPGVDQQRAMPVGARLWQFAGRILRGEQIANMLGSLPVARHPDRENAEILSEKDLKELRHSLAHLSVTAVRDFYERAYRDCRLMYNRLPSPKQVQTLVQIWKQLRKWR
jgi:hypothetical protein